MTPVAWRVKDFADGWIICQSESEAQRLVVGTGGVVEALYASPEVDRTLATAGETIMKLDALVARKDAALLEMLEIAELFVPLKLDAPGFKRARAALKEPSQ